MTDTETYLQLLQESLERAMLKTFEEMGDDVQHLSFFGDPDGVPTI